jgi:hypothetical protein
VQDHKPRYKLRTRHYVTTHGCVFEVKVKREDGNTDKHSIDYDGNSEADVTEEARALIEQTLGDAGVQLPQQLECTLVTEFTRSTLGLRDGPERTTIDRGLRLTASDGRALVMDRGLTLIETKTEDGNGRCDRALAEAGVEPISFSKYRLGVGRLLAPSADPGYAEQLKRCFSIEDGGRGA